MSKPVARSSHSLDSLEYMRKVLQAQDQIAQLEMQVQETSADSRATVRTAEPIGKSYTELRSMAKELQGGLKNLKIEEFARAALARDVGTLVLDTIALGTRIKILNREIDLKSRMTEISCQTPRPQQKQDAASALRANATRLSALIANSPNDITASLISHMLAMQAILRQQAHDLGKPATTGKRESALSASRSSAPPSTSTARHKKEGAHAEHRSDVGTSAPRSSAPPSTSTAHPKIEGAHAEHRSDVGSSAPRSPTPPPTTTAQPTKEGSPADVRSETASHAPRSPTPPPTGTAQPKKEAALTGSSTSTASAAT